MAKQEEAATDALKSIKERAYRSMLWIRNKPWQQVQIFGAKKRNQ